VTPPWGSALPPLLDDAPLAVEAPDAALDSDIEPPDAPTDSGDELPDEELPEADPLPDSDDEPLDSEDDAPLVIADDAAADCAVVGLAVVPELPQADASRPMMPAAATPEMDLRNMKASRNGSAWAPTAN